MTTALADLRPWLIGPAALLFLLNLAVASCLIGGLGLLAVRCCRHRSAPLQHGLLVVVLFWMVVSPLLFWLAAAFDWGLHVPLATAALSGQESQPNSLPLWVQSELGELMSADALAGDGNNPPVPTDAGSPLLAIQTVGTLLACVWGIGTAVVVARFVRGLGTLARLRATLREVHDPALTRAAVETLQQLGIRQRVGLYHAPLALVPFSLGLFRPRIVLPAGLAGCLDAEQVRYVLLHEAAHIRRGDHWVALLQYGCTALFWWTPLLRRVNARLARLREQICDDHVTWAGGDGRRFAEALVRVAEWGAVRPDALCSAALLDSRCADPDGEDGICRELEERIVRLVRKRRPSELRMSRASRVAVAALGLLVSVALPIAGLRAADPATESKHSTEIADELEAQGSAIRAQGGNPRPERPAAGSQRILANQWLMYLPAGFVHEVALTSLGGNRYRLEPAWLNSSGVYEVQGGRLVIVQPNDRRLLGFQWEIRPDGHLILVGQPPRRETGANYLGATLVPVTE